MDSDSPDSANNEPTSDPNLIDLDEAFLPFTNGNSAIEQLSFGTGHEQLDTASLSPNDMYAKIPETQTEYQDTVDTSGTTLSEYQSISELLEEPISYEDSNEILQDPASDTQEVEHNNNGPIPIQSDPTANQAIASIANFLQNAINEFSEETILQTTMDAMQRNGQPLMYMARQPNARHRFRYRSDGIRYLEESRTHPMTIGLPNLAGCLTQVYQSFWIQCTIVTTQNNPQRRVFVHQHEISYKGQGAIENGVHSFRIPLTEDDILHRRKIFRHFSVTKTLRNDYVYDLTPFDPLMNVDHILSYTIPDGANLSKMKKAKRFDREFHTNEYRIVLLQTNSLDDDFPLYLNDSSQEENISTVFKDNRESLINFTDLYNDISVDLSWLSDTVLNISDEHSSLNVSQQKDLLPLSTSSNATSNVLTGNDNIVNHQHLVENELCQNLDYDLREEIIPYSDTVNEAVESVYSETIANDPILSNVVMVVKEQPKAAHRVRYPSDGKRFLPNSRQHPMMIQFSDLSTVTSLISGTFGVIMTMVTSTNNLNNQTFVHVNSIKYHTNDAIDLDYGSVFVPLTKSDIISREKSFPRASITCKKFDEYTFALVSFDTLASDRHIQQYTIPNEDRISKVAKGKQFTSDYDLHCYKIVFQLAVKQENCICILPVTCETDLINEQKTATKGVKRKSSPADQMDTSMIRPVKKAKSSVFFIPYLKFLSRCFTGTVTRTTSGISKQVQGPCMDSPLSILA
ncbi:unnamed protein product, partial [Adineta ricciae]